MLFATATAIATVWSASVVAASPSVPLVAQDEPAELRNQRIVPPPSGHRSSAEEEANKRIVLQWHYEFFDLGHFRQAADKYMSSDFRQNDPDESSGREQYVSEFEHNGYVPRPAAARPPLIAVLADGDLVMTVIPVQWDPKSSKDPEAGFIHCNMYRVKHGRITAMWVSGDAARAPAAK